VSSGCFNIIEQQTMPESSDGAQDPKEGNNSNEA
jgi:hypothetical protein